MGFGHHPVMESPTTQTVGDRVREALRDAQLPATQEQAAKIAGVSQPSVSDWNRPNTFPRMAVAVEIASKLNVCVEWLLTGRGPKRIGEAADAELAKILLIWDKLLPETRRKVAGYAAYERSIQSTAEPERVREIHTTILPAANHTARAKAAKTPKQSTSSRRTD